MPVKGRSAAIPAPTGVKDPAVSRTLWAIYERLNAFDPQQLKRDTEKIARQAGASAGGGGGNGTRPIRPNVPVNLQATGIFGAIILEIDGMPAGAAAIEWLAAPANDLSQSQVVGQSAIPLFKHYVGDNATRWYWARAVGFGQNPLKSGLNATEGTKGQSARDPEFLKNQLDKAIGQDQLAIDLSEKIAGIGKPYTIIAVRDKDSDEAGLHQQGQRLGGQPAYGWNIYRFNAEGDYIAHKGYYNGDADFDATNDAANYINGGSFTSIVVAGMGATGYYLGGKLKDELVKLGGNRVTLDNLGSNESYILVGYKDAGAGNGYEQTGNGRISHEIRLSQGYPTDTSGAGAALATYGKITADLGAQQVIKAQYNGVIAGIGAASGPTGPDGVTQSRIYFQADRVGFISRATDNLDKVVYPLTTEGDDTFIDSALIKKASIVSAQIKSLAANKIVADQLSAISANLGTVTAGRMQTVTRDGRVEVRPDGVFVYDGSGRPRIEIGRLA